MARIQEVQENITHRRMWLQVLVAIDIGLGAWFFTHYEEARFLLIILDISAIIGVSGLIWAMNQHIEALMRQLRDL